MSAVDDFLETLTADYSALYKENAILKSKIKVLVEKVEEYRSTEDAMRMALLTAQKLGEEITADAKKKSEDMLGQTETDVKDRLAEMKSKFAEEDDRLNSIKEETRKFILASQEIMRQHSGFLSKIEGMGREPEVAPVTVTEPKPVYYEEPATTDADEITETARQIDSALSNLSEPEPEIDSFKPRFTDSDTENVFRMTREYDKPDEDESTSPRPKFDFNNLKFGSNYSGD